MPSGGGFDEATTLLCFHQSPMSGRVFEKFLATMGEDRTVYAPDTPGFGNSDAPPNPPTIADYAGAMLDFIAQMQFRKLDLLGYHTGALIAAEVALALPEIVRRIVMVGVPVLEEAERAAIRQSPWPLPPSEDGSYLLKEWERSQKWRGPGVTLEMLARAFAEKLYNGPRAWWGANAVIEYAARERLGRLRQPVLVLRPKDDLWEATLRARSILKNAQYRDLPDYGHGVFEVAPDLVSREVRTFLPD
ncbi:MAG: alpha/beta hydrolase [Steroidobacteraceae bacterium]|nr:alpha/beta hydrolase [Steroidobacteraceae bacterium]